MHPRKPARSLQPLFVAVLSLAIVCSGAACRSIRRGEPLVGALPAVSPEIERGRILFAQTCYKCHPGGEGGLGPGLNDKCLPGFLMKTQVRLGLGVMPSFAPHRISPNDLNDLMAYVLALRKSGVPASGPR